MRRREDNLYTVRNNDNNNNNNNNNNKYDTRNNTFISMRENKDITPMPLLNISCFSG
jgi:hypothetical protein